MRLPLLLTSTAGLLAPAASLMSSAPAATSGYSTTDLGSLGYDDSAAPSTTAVLLTPPKSQGNE
jgi:hypothetical protein